MMMGLCLPLWLVLLPFIMINPATKWIRDDSVRCIIHRRSNQNSGSNELICNTTKIYATGGPLQIINFLNAGFSSGRNTDLTGSENIVIQEKLVDEEYPAELPDYLHHTLNSEEEKYMDESHLHSAEEFSPSTNYYPFEETFSTVYQFSTKIILWIRTLLPCIFENDHIFDDVKALPIVSFVLDAKNHDFLLRLFTRVVRDSLLVVVLYLCGKLVKRCFTEYRRRKLHTWELVENLNLNGETKTSTERGKFVVENKYKEFIAYNKWRDFGEVLRFEGKRTQNFSSGVITIIECFSMSCVGIRERENFVKFFEMSFKKESTLVSLLRFELRNTQLSICNASGSNEETESQEQNPKSLQNKKSEKTAIDGKLPSRTFSQPDIRVFRKISVHELPKYAEDLDYRSQGSLNIAPSNRHQMVAKRTHETVRTSAIIESRNEPWTKPWNQREQKQRKNISQSVTGFSEIQMNSRPDVLPEELDFTKPLFSNSQDVHSTSDLCSRASTPMNNNNNNMFRFSSTKVIRKKPVVNCVGFKPFTLQNFKSNTRLRSSRKEI